MKPLIMYFSILLLICFSPGSNILLKYFALKHPRIYTPPIRLEAKFRTYTEEYIELF
jgi:hypothetical protein